MNNDPQVSGEQPTSAENSAGQLILREKENLVEDVWSFRFLAEPALHWQAGQYVHVSLPHDNPDDEGIERWFTISSAPGDGYVEITTRLTGTSFKQALAELDNGDRLRLLEHPEGDFIWEDSALNRYYVAGGIGITPFRSILRDRFRHDLPVPVHLIYGGRSENLPFKEELERIADERPEFTLSYLIGQPLSYENLLVEAPELTNGLVYLSGPEPMVESLGASLKRNGLKDGQLHQDFFPNYDENNY